MFFGNRYWRARDTVWCSVFVLYDLLCWYSGAGFLLVFLVPMQYMALLWQTRRNYKEYWAKIKTDLFLEETRHHQ